MSEQIFNHRGFSVRKLEDGRFDIHDGVSIVGNIVQRANGVHLKFDGLTWCVSLEQALARLTRHIDRVLGVTVVGMDVDEFMQRYGVHGTEQPLAYSDHYLVYNRKTRKIVHITESETDAYIGRDSGEYVLRPLHKMPSYAKESDPRLAYPAAHGL